MDAAAIDRIVKLTEERRTIVQAPDFEVDGTYLVRQEDGSYQAANARRQPLEGVVRSTASLADLITLDVDEAETTVFYDRDQIVAVHEGSAMRWRHTLPLPLHPAYARASALQRTETFNQRDLIRLLRAEMNGHVSDHVVEQFRTLKLRADTEGNSVLAKGREAVDRRIQQHVTAAAGQEIPDEITVTVPVYDLDETRAELHPVTILVEPRAGDDGAVTFELTAVLNTLRTAQRDALDALVEVLEAQLPDRVSATLYGSPSKSGR